MSDAILKLENVRVSFYTFAGEVQAVRGVSLSILPGEMLGIVGESGSGKSVTAMSTMKLIQYPGKITGGSILYHGENLVDKSNKEMRQIRGKGISMVFQDPMTSLNPVLKVGFQLAESIRGAFPNLSRKEVRELSVELLHKVQIPSPEKRLSSYPFELSGGMRQRIVFAMAIASNPEVLIADEPTTALDVTVQREILSLMQGLNRDLNSAVMLITHDLGVVAETCERMVVMYGGMIMEEGTTKEIFGDPQHPYTIALQRSIPKLNHEKKDKLWSIPGSPPNMLNPPKGCPFAGRCNQAMKICREMLPPITQITDTHKSMCWRNCAQSPKKVERYDG